MSIQHSHISRVADGMLAEHWARREDVAGLRQLGAGPRAPDPGAEPPGVAISTGSGDANREAARNHRPMTTTPAGTARILVIANRTASTPALLDEISRHGRAGARFTILVPTHGSEDWTTDTAQRVCTKAAGDEVATIECGADPLDTIHRAIGEQAFDEIIVSTAPEHLAAWIHHDLPHRIKHLGLPVTVIHEADAPPPDHVKEGLPDEWNYSSRPLVEGLGANG